MNKIYSLLFFIPSVFFGQVGIKTSTPTHTLDVNGDTLVESYLIENENRNITGPFLLYARSKDSSPVGEIKKLDPAILDVAPVNRYKITITNVKQDQVLNLNTSLSASKYFLSISDARFSAAIPSGNNLGSLSEYGAYTNGIGVNSSGNYTISLDFAGTGTTSAVNGTWEIQLIAYDIALLKDYGTVNVTWDNYIGEAPAGIVDHFK